MFTYQHIRTAYLCPYRNVLKRSQREPIPIRAIQRLTNPNTRLGQFAKKLPDDMSYKVELLTMCELIHNTKCRPDFVRFELPAHKKIETPHVEDDVHDGPDIHIVVSNNTEPERVCINFDERLLALDLSRAAFFDAKLWNLTTGTAMQGTARELYQLWTSSLDQLAQPRPSRDLCSQCSALYHPCKFGMANEK